MKDEEKEKSKIDWLQVLEILVRILTIGIYHMKKNGNRAFGT